MKQGPFPPRRFCCPSGSSGTTGPSATLPTGRDFADGLYAPIASRAANRRLGAGEGFPSSRIDHPTVPLPLPRGVLDRCTSRIYTASMAFALNSRARLPLAPAHGTSVTRRQDSLDVTDRPVASPRGAFDTGLRPRAFPPDAASLLPGALALTGTGLPPAGRHELMFRSGQTINHLQTLGTRTSG